MRYAPFLRLQFIRKKGSSHMSQTKQKNDEIETVEEFQFEPIKGYPMLNWRGKRPFRSTNFYPAQLKETHGDAVDGWYNRIYWGDNLQVMSHLLKEFRGKIDLIYIDPPFDSKADYKKKVKLKNQKAENDHSAFEEKQYTDIWTNDEYLQFMYERLMLAKELMSENGRIFVHVDYRKSSYLRCILDEIFGASNFKNEIIWHYSGWLKASSSQFARKHDNIFFYTKTNTSKINTVYESWVEGVSLKEINQYEFHKDDDGEYVLLNNEKVYVRSILSNYIANRKQAVHMDEEGEFVWADGRNIVKRYLKDVLLGGKSVDDVWNIKALTTSAIERVDYPTQKPEELIERIVKAASNPDDLVFDCFMGSGTLQAVAAKLGRRYIGADINLGAVQTTTKRLLNVTKSFADNESQLDLEGASRKFYTGFQVYNVNHYDVFRNPVQAKELLIEALEIQPLAFNTIYDGEKDGRMVKVMPVNRITTRADLNELITNFDYKTFEKRQADKPNQPVEKILLVCMGHEPNLAAILEQETGFKLDVEVVDILRDRQDLQFKRDAEAKISVKDGKLNIEAFYPMNLLQKLSMMQENVEEWRELAESVMIDWNYDGAIFEPKTVDIPEKKELVSGVYDVPSDAGTIRVKITDLLSESLEVEVKDE